MKNNRLPFLVLGLLAFAGALWLSVQSYMHRPDYLPALEEEQRVGAFKKRHPELIADVAVQPTAARRPGERVRLAVGELGLVDGAKSRKVGDLVTAQLTGVPQLELVERQELDRVLREQTMTLAGVVRAKEAVRIGQLVRADWFLLSSHRTIGGTNVMVERIVDARSGVLIDVGIVENALDPLLVASRLADFVRQHLQATDATKPSRYLAIGGFANVGVNNQRSEFPAQLRDFLTGTYRNSNVTLLEREAVDFLLREVRLDLASLTEESKSTNPTSRMQPAFWVLDGFYQALGADAQGVELVMQAKRAFGPTDSLNLSGAVNSVFLGKVRAFVDKQIATAGPWSNLPTRRQEVETQLETGQTLMTAAWGRPPLPFPSFGMNWGNEIDHPRRRHNLEQAIQAFQAVLMLVPDNRQGKLLLGACLSDCTIMRLDEAKSYLREVFESGTSDKWGETAKQLVQSIDWRYLGKAPEPEAIDATSRAEAEPDDLLSRAETRFLRTARTNIYQAFQEFDGIAQTDKDRAAERLAALWPRLRKDFSQSAPSILAHVLAFQVDTNTPLIAEFREMLASRVQDPERVSDCRDYFRRLVFVDYPWAIDQGVYPLESLNCRSCCEQIKFQAARRSVV